MINQDGWFDWMERRPGPADKVNSNWNNVRLYIPHSAVGYYGGWQSRLFSQDRRSDGLYTAYAAASVHGWINYDGTCIQHYSIFSSCWASGSLWPNNNGISFENEGGYSPENEPLTVEQVLANVRILVDLAAWKNEGLDYWRRPTSVGDLNATLYEHRECTRWGSAPTACPSNRIPWDEILNQLSTLANSPPPPTPAPDLQLDLTIAQNTLRAINAFSSGRLIGVPGYSSDTIEVHQIVNGEGRPFSPPIYLPT